MGNESRDTQAGISYRDVADLLRQIGKEHGGRASFVLSLPVRSDHGVALEVRCRLSRRAGPDSSWVDSSGVSGRWPSGGSATFAGLLFKLAYDLLGKLDQEVAEAERAARAQKRLL